MLRVAIAALLVVTLTVNASPRRRAAAPPAGMAKVARVIVIMLENEDASSAERQPFLSQLAAEGALLGDYHALLHPSQPNYIALVAGSAFGIHSDAAVSIDGQHLGDLLDAAHVSWKVYAEDYPGGCFLGEAWAAAKGAYVRRHVPFASFLDVTTNSDRCRQTLHDGDEFDADVAAHTLPRFSFYVPNTWNDGHDSGVAAADAWMRQRFEPLMRDPDFAAGTLLVVLFDEADTSSTNQVYGALWGAGIQPGSVAYDYYDHYSVLRTIEEIFHLGTLHRHDETAPVISGIWSR